MRADRNEAFEHALDSESPTMELRRVVQDLVSAGADRDQIRGEVEALRSRLRRADQEADEDVVLEVLDFLTGWSSPHMKIE